MSEIAGLPSRGRLLIIDDDDVLRGLLVQLLQGEGYTVEAVESGEAGLAVLERESCDLVLVDLNLPGINGINVLATAASLHTPAQFIMMTGFSDVDSAVEAMKLGAFDYLAKPLRTEELLVVLDRALRHSELRREVTQLRRKVGNGALGGMVGKSPAIQRVFGLIERVAPTRATVLVTGETGTGKELVARAIHDLSDRARKPFVPVNCSAFPETLLESELFGHVKGSFTGAINSRQGLFEEANGGTLFLDEISTISPAIQVKLLRVLQERKIQRLGASQAIPLDLRLIAATNEDLTKAVAAGRFRDDLYYRLNVYPIHVPPLRERRSDIPLLAKHFYERFAQENGVSPLGLPGEVMVSLMNYTWPGNVRELENFMERLVIMNIGGTEFQFEPPVVVEGPQREELLEQAVREDWSLERLEREYILCVMEKTQGHKGQAAEILHLDRRTLYRKLKEYAHADGSQPEYAVQA